MAKCNARHPDDGARTCLLSPGSHGHHSDARGVWDNAEVQEAVATKQAHRPSKKGSRKKMLEMAAKASAGRVQFLAEERAKHQGMDQALQATPEQFRAHFLDAVHHLALHQPTLTSDDVWAVLADQGIDTESRAAVGPLMAAAAKRGWIEKTKGRAVSGRPGSKSRDGLTIWASRIAAISGSS